MTTISYPAKGTGGFTIGHWTEVWEDSNGVINDYTGNSCSLTRVDASNLAQIGVGQVRVGGYVLEITATHDLTVSTSAATYYIWACYDPALNVAGGGGAASADGPCTLGISTGAPSTSGGKIYTLLYQIVRGASQALSAATVKDFRTWVGPTLHMPAASTIPSELLTDPETAVVGFGYPVGARLVHGAGTEYTHVKSTSGLRWLGSITPDVQVFTANGTWTKPTGATWVLVQCQGGGGAGGGAAATGGSESSGGGGGQGGAYAESLLAASTLAGTVAVTRGAGGAGVAGAAGNSGGTSSFGAHVSAAGGEGGDATSAAGTVGLQRGGDASQSMTGQVQIDGGGGGAGGRLGTNDALGGSGGNSFMGNGGGGNSGSNIGKAGHGYGGGGAGSTNANSQSSRAGGAGSAGVVIITSYYG